ncbi:hypothetical protein Y032_0390g560 [Ancylostoma ceylanicum]|uniref:Uncharacterized protein n=1 Tax=Ancylostoma ceylanicum TaxID=53326 RepID=A0A016RT79_9BILA|nr:hypothetical protein Y032_0390g560 [Ancylostoma ceylanicum]
MLQHANPNEKNSIPVPHRDWSGLLSCFSSTLIPMRRTAFRFLIAIGLVCSLVLADKAADLLKGASHKDNETVVGNASETIHAKNSTKIGTGPCFNLVSVAVPLAIYFLL